MLNSIKKRWGKTPASTPAATTATESTASKKVVPEGRTPSPVEGAPFAQHANQNAAQQLSTPVSQLSTNLLALSMGNIDYPDIELKPELTTQTTGKARYDASIAEEIKNIRGSGLYVPKDAAMVLHGSEVEDAESLLRELPRLNTAPPNQLEKLFLEKLLVCSVVGFDWNDPTANLVGKAIKRETLLELVEYIGEYGGPDILNENTYKACIYMVSSNVLREFPKPDTHLPPEEAALMDMEDFTPTIKPCWSHLQLVYEFLLRFVLSDDVRCKTAKNAIDIKFCTQLIELFASDDPHERDYLKTVVHRIYGKFTMHRAAIRRTISHALLDFVYEKTTHHGIAELLEILGSIINGFALPLKGEHVAFLRKSLLPLHKPEDIVHYYPHFLYCLSQYIEKEPSTAEYILEDFLKNWSTTSLCKQVLLLNEFEDILELAMMDIILPMLPDVLRIFRSCIECDHYQVCERALLLWNNEKLVSTGILSASYAEDVLPEVFEGLVKQTEHWSPSVSSLATTVLQHYESSNPTLYGTFHDQLAAKRREEFANGGEEIMAENQRREREAMWKVVEDKVADARKMKGSDTGLSSEDIQAIDNAVKNKKTEPGLPTLHEDADNAASKANNDTTATKELSDEANSETKSAHDQHRVQLTGLKV